MRISDWSSDVCSSDLTAGPPSIAEQLLLQIERAARSVVRPRPLVSARAARLQAFQKLLGTAAFLQLLEHGRGILHLVLQHALEIRLVGDVAPRPADLDRHGDAGKFRGAALSLNGADELGLHHVVDGARRQRNLAFAGHAGSEAHTSELQSL